VAGRAAGDIVEKGRDNVEHDILKFPGEIYYKKPFLMSCVIETPQQEAVNQSHLSQQCGKSKEESLVHAH